MIRIFFTHSVIFSTISLYIPVVVLFIYLYYYSGIRIRKGIHLDLDTWIVPGQILTGRGLENGYKPAGTEVLISAVAHNNPIINIVLLLYYYYYYFISWMYFFPGLQSNHESFFCRKLYISVLFFVSLYRFVSLC